MSDESSGDNTARPWHLQVQWSEVFTETYPTFEAAHKRAIELVRDHEGAGGVVHGGIEHVAVSASYYSRPENAPLV